MGRLAILARINEMKKYFVDEERGRDVGGKRRAVFRQQEVTP